MDWNILSIIIDAVKTSDQVKLKEITDTYKLVSIDGGFNYFEIRDPNAENILSCAVKVGNLAILQELIDNGGDLNRCIVLYEYTDMNNVKQQIKIIPIEYALYNKNIELFNFLFNKKPYIVDFDSNLLHIKNADERDFVLSLLKKNDLNFEFKSKLLLKIIGDAKFPEDKEWVKKSIITAKEAININFIIDLLNSNYSVKTNIIHVMPIIKYETVIRINSYYHFKEFVEDEFRKKNIYNLGVLLDLFPGIVDLFHVNGNSLLIRAISLNDQFIFNKLIDIVSKSTKCLEIINFKDNAFETPLYVAVKQKRNDCVKQLLRFRGIEVILFRKERNNPFILACKNADLDIIKLCDRFVSLILQQGYFNPMNYLNFFIPEDQIAELKLLQCTSFFIKKGFSYEDCLISALLKDNIPFLGCLVKNGVDIDRVMIYNEKPIVFLIKNKRTEAIKVILSGEFRLNVAEFADSLNEEDNNYLKEHFPNLLLANRPAKRGRDESVDSDDDRRPSKKRSESSDPEDREGQSR